MHLFQITTTPITSIKIIVLSIMLCGITVGTRFLPFWLKGFFEKSILLKKVGDLLPSAIMFLLIFHTLEDVHITKFPFALPEVFSLAIAIILHVWKRNLLLSLFTSTLIYIVIVNSMS